MEEETKKEIEQPEITPAEEDELLPEPAGADETDETVSPEPQLANDLLSKLFSFLFPLGQRKLRASFFASALLFFGLKAGLTMPEALTVVSPILSWVGIEGIADIKER